MRTRSFAWVGALCLGMGIVAASAVAQHEQPKKPDAAKPAAQPEKTTKPASAPTGQTMPEAMMPGPEHEAMKALTGNWTCDLSFTMAPGAPPEKSSGTMTRKLIMDGRYLAEDFEGTAGGAPFKGHGLMGFNRGTKQWESIWIDSMGTGVGYWTGKGDIKKIILEGDNYCPMEGKVVHDRHVFEAPTKDKNILKMYRKGPDGKEYQNFDMTCTRQ